jgi:hypothetical protein
MWNSLWSCLAQIHLLPDTKDAYLDNTALKWSVFFQMIPQLTACLTEMNDVFQLEIRCNVEQDIEGDSIEGRHCGLV